MICVSGDSKICHFHFLIMIFQFLIDSFVTAKKKNSIFSRSNFIYVREYTHVNPSRTRRRNTHSVCSVCRVSATKTDGAYSNVHSTPVTNTHRSGTYLRCLNLKRSFPTCLDLVCIAEIPVETTFFCPTSTESKLDLNMYMLLVLWKTVLKHLEFRMFLRLNVATWEVELYHAAFEHRSRRCQVSPAICVIASRPFLLSLHPTTLCLAVSKSCLNTTKWCSNGEFSPAPLSIYNWSNYFINKFLSTRNFNEIFDKT